MSFRRISEPVCLPVELAAAKANLRIDGDDLDAVVTLWIEGITESLEHEIGQCLMTQAWCGAFSGFKDGLPLPHPATNVTKIEYVDQNGDLCELDPAAVKIVQKRYSSSLHVVAPGSWPLAGCGEDSVSITVECGYGGEPKFTPRNVQLYILAKLVDQFDPATQSEKKTPQSVYIDRLLDACRSY
jgi:uncharacterized phiE125 gp8 family phage protein